MKGLGPGARLRAAACLFATAAAAAVVLAAGPAQAATVPVARSLQVTGPAATAAASCNPKLDYEVLNNNTGTTSWSNFCGTGTGYIAWSLPGVPLSEYSYSLWAVRMPTTPYHRVWLHQNADGTGLTACFYSKNQDLYISNYVNKYGTWIYTPGNIQVSANTSSC